MHGKRAGSDPWLVPSQRGTLMRAAAGGREAAEIWPHCAAVGYRRASWAPAGTRRAGVAVRDLQTDRKCKDGIPEVLGFASGSPGQQDLGQQSPPTTPLTRRAQRAAHPSPRARSGRRRVYQRVHKHHACSGLGGAPFEGAGRDRPARQLPPLQAAARPRARQQWVHQQHPDDASSPAGEPVGGSAICYAPAPAGLPGPLVAPPAANSALWES